MMPRTRQDTRVLIAVCLLAFVVRGLLALMSPLVGTDAFAYLLGAKEIGGGDWQTMLGTGIHPAYPVTIWLVGAVLGNLEAAGYLVSVLASTLAIIPLYLLVRDLASRRLAILTVLFFACCPVLVREHADIMTEGLFHLFFIASIAFAWFAATRQRVVFYLLSAVAGALAYATRPEGICAPLALMGIVALAWITDRTRWRSLGFALGSLALFLAIAIPLFLGFKQVAGRWTVTHRGSAQAVLTALTGGEVDPSVRTCAMDKKVAQTNRAYLFIVGPLALLGLFLVRDQMRRLGAAYLVCLAVGLAVLSVLAAWGGHGGSYRHLLLTLIFLFPLAGLPIFAWHDRLRSVVARRIIAVLLGLLFAGMIPIAMRPQRQHLVALREASLWLAERIDPKTPVYTNAGAVAWYVQRRTNCPSADLALPMGSYAVLIDDNDGLATSFAARYPQLCTFGGTGCTRWVRIFTP